MSWRQAWRVGCGETVLQWESVECESEGMSASEGVWFSDGELWMINAGDLFLLVVEAGKTVDLSALWMHLCGDGFGVGLGCGVWAEVAPMEGEQLWGLHQHSYHPLTRPSASDGELISSLHLTLGTMGVCSGTVNYFFHIHQA